MRGDRVRGRAVKDRPCIATKQWSRGVTATHLVLSQESGVQLPSGLQYAAVVWFPTLRHQARLAQLAEALDSGSRGSRFESGDGYEPRTCPSCDRPRGWIRVAAAARQSADLSKGCCNTGQLSQYLSGGTVYAPHSKCGSREGMWVRLPRQVRTTHAFVAQLVRALL